MQSYLRYKEYYDRKAKAAPLQENDFCFVLQPKADTQGSKIPFRDFRRTGPFVVQKVLPNNNYIVSCLKTNKTQILHRIRLKKFIPNTPLEDKYSKEKLQPDDEIIIPQDDLYTISWEADFDYQVFEPRQDEIPNEELQQADTNGNGSNDDYVIYDNANDDAVRPRTATSRECILARDANDVSEVNERTTAENETRPRTTASRDAPILHDENDVNEHAAKDEQRSEIRRPSTATSRDNQNTGDTPTDPLNENNDSTRNSPNRGEDNSVPGISDNVNNAENETSSPRGGKYNLRPNPNPNFTDEYRY